MNDSHPIGTHMQRPARRAVTQADVDAAANAILASGGRASVRAVRERLGSGSFSTIGPKLESWRDAQGIREGSAPASQLPLAVARSVHLAIDENVERATTRLQTDLDDARLATQLAVEELNEIKDRLAASEEAVAALRRTNDLLRRDLEETREQHRLDRATLESDRESADNRTAAAEERVRQLEARLALLEGRGQVG